MPRDEHRGSRLRRADEVAGDLAGGIVRVVAVLVAIALVLYAGLWVLDLLSFGSELDDFNLQPNISVGEPPRCEPGEAARYRQIGGREFYVVPEGGCR